MVMLNTLEFRSLLRSLTETLLTASLYVQEIHSAFQSDQCEQLERGGPGDGLRLDHGGARLTRWPACDETRFTVIWNGKSLHLGNTRGYWLMAHLTHRPNCYVTHLELLNEVWEDEELSTATIRSTVCQLRDRLRRNGMHDLADAIRGHNGHYTLSL